MVQALLARNYLFQLKVEDSLIGNMYNQMELGLLGIETMTSPIRFVLTDITQSQRVH
jgi:hypothetical protein